MSTHRAGFLIHDYTNAQLREILTGLTDDEAVQKLGVCKSTVRYQRKRLGLLLVKKVFWNEDRVNEFIDYYVERNYSLKEMAERYNTTIGYIKYLLTYFRCRGYDVPYIRKMR